METASVSYYGSKIPVDELHKKLDVLRYFLVWSLRELSFLVDYFVIHKNRLRMPSIILWTTVMGDFPPFLFF